MIKTFVNYVDGFTKSGAKLFEGLLNKLPFANAKFYAIISTILAGVMMFITYYDNGVVYNLERDISFTSHNWTISEMIRRSDGSTWVPLFLTTGFFCATSILVRSGIDKLSVVLSAMCFLGFLSISLLKIEQNRTATAAEMAGIGEISKSKAKGLMVYHMSYTMVGITCLVVSVLFAKSTAGWVKIGFGVTIALALMTKAILFAYTYISEKEGEALRDDLIHFMNAFAILEHMLFGTVLLSQVF